VGTVTEIYDYLRLLFARAGIPRCPDHDTTLEAQTVSQMVDQVLAMPEGARLMLLAPVVDNRKGEHVQLMQDLMAQGFIRARIDGEVYELDQPPKLDLRRKHTIEAIVDRFRVKQDIRLRLAESFETALRIADGVARIAWMDDVDQEEIVFSDRFACNLCGYSLTELEPRLFSFNNPSGACPSCDGLGVKQFFDPERVVVNRSLSLAGGAIRGWDRRTTYYYQMIRSLADHYEFDVETPFEDLGEKLQHIVLFGSGSDKIDFFYQNSRGMEVRKKHRFEGVIPNLERRYRETESSAVREELARFLNSQACPECGGTRLNRAARHVFVGDHSLPEITRKSVGSAKKFFNSLELEGWRATIADKIVKEIGDRIGFLSDVGLDYLSLDRSAETLSGGEAQRIRLASQIGSGLVGVMYILDEPSIGLHQRDNQRLLGTLTHLRDIGNTVIVVEHDEEGCAGDARRDHEGRELADRPVPLGQARHRDSRRSHRARPGAPDPHRRCQGQQPQRHRGVHPRGPHDLRDGRIRLGQVDARQRHPVQGRRRPAQPHQPQPGAARRDPGPRPHRPGHRYQPESDRPHAALEPGHVQRSVHADP
jgi:excinuclease ABC subunit A